MSETGEPVTPKSWRVDEEYSTAQVAVLVGLRGKTARMTYLRYERGENDVPLEIVAQVEKLSGGKVTYRGWLAAQREYRAAHPRRERAAA